MPECTTDPASTRAGKQAFSELHAASRGESMERTMNRKSSALILSATLALAGIGLVATPAAQAQVIGVGVNVGIGVPPPPPRYEVVPAPRFGYVWAPGYWMWSPRMHRHIWVGGRWVHARPGWRYLPPHWDRGPHGNWHFRGGYWAR